LSRFHVLSSWLAFALPFGPRRAAVSIPMFALALMTQSDPNDAELLERVAIGRGSRPVRDAQAELYKRHAAYLRLALAKRCARLLELTQQSAEDLVQDTFERAFERARTFDAEGLTDADRLRRRVRAWLGAIAQRLLADSLTRVREAADTPLVEAASEAVTEELLLDSPEVSAMAKALGALSDREQDVLRISALYYRVGEQHQRLPNVVAAELAERWDTTSENVRAIRSRAIKKLRTALSGEALKFSEDA
jgi:RNA polymerase sigma factor (sigma-70 family)